MNIRTKKNRCFNSIGFIVFWQIKQYHCTLKYYPTYKSLIQKNPIAKNSEGFFAYLIT